MKKNLYILLFLAVTVFLFTTCKQSPTATEPEDPETTVHGLPDWVQSANMYEMNIRQYTPEGTLTALEKHLPRLREMGVDILWFMPLHPISEVKRKGPLGSYYAVSDFRAVNPNFGTKEDFDNIIKKAHDLGMYVLMDWVPNHTGWDHPWIEEHPDWYTHTPVTVVKDSDTINIGGDTIIHALSSKNEYTDWTDVAELNYDSKDMRQAMIEDMKYWISEHDIDGYRCDHAHGIPVDFWIEATTELRKLKPILLLGETDTDTLRTSGSFDMTYGWRLHHTMNEIARGRQSISRIDTFLAQERKRFQTGFTLHFTSNHDENSWNGTVFERLGEGDKTFFVLAATLDGMPLIYSGQEEPLRKRLAFFKKDTIGFKDYAYAGFFKTLLDLKGRNKALWNGDAGGKPVRINDSESVYAFKREKNGDKVIVVLNLSGETVEASLEEGISGDMKEVFSGESKEVPAGETFSLDGWAYWVFSNR